MRKSDARKLFISKRDEITATDKLKWDDLILIQLQTLDLPFLSSILSFYPIEQNNEVDTFPITEYFHFRNPGLKISYPKTDLSRFTMQAVICKTDTLFEANRYNIPEPKESEVEDPQSLDLVIVPLLAFDESGLRVGYGKGFYDRYLTQCRPDCIKLGLSYFEAVEPLEDANEYDVPLDFCITPKRVYVF